MNDKFYIFENIILIAQKWQDQADRIIEDKIGITIRQWMLILMIQQDFTDHLPTITEAAEKFGTSRQNIKRLAIELQKKGFLLLATDPADHRILRIALTGKHRQFMEGESNILWQKQFLDLFLGKMDEKDLQYLKHGIHKIMTAIH
ncbi:MAG: MarR family winged helix-turn-helix transcriptional regulator [Bacteroidota bacterium]